AEADRPQQRSQGAPKGPKCDPPAAVITPTAISETLDLRKHGTKVLKQLKDAQLSDKPKSTVRKTDRPRSGKRSTSKTAIGPGNGPFHGPGNGQLSIHLRERAAGETVDRGATVQLVTAPNGAAPKLPWTRPTVTELSPEEAAPYLA